MLKITGRNHLLGICKNESFIIGLFNKFEIPNNTKYRYQLNKFNQIVDMSYSERI